MGLIELISERANAEFKNVPYLRSIPCRVVEIIDDTMSVVECVSNNAKYTLPNYSANAVSEGDDCIVYYTNNTPVGVTGYIGATVGATKESVPVNKIESGVSNVIASESYKTLSTIGLKCRDITVVTLFINLNVYGNTEGNFQLRVVLGDETEPFEPIQTVSIGAYSNISYSVPITLQSGETRLTISCMGNGTVSQGKVYVVGHGVEQYDAFEPTTEEDYLYLTGTSGAYTRAYIGDKSNIAMPVELGGMPIITVGGATFNYTDVTGVYISDGVEEIE